MSSKFGLNSWYLKDATVDWKPNEKVGSQMKKSHIEYVPHFSASHCGNITFDKFVPVILSQCGKERKKKKQY